MHEYSIVQSLLESCEEHVQENKAEKVTKLVVKIGVMSGVEPYLLKEAFEVFKEGSVCDGCVFKMNIQKLKIVCNSCHSTNELEANAYLCPECKSNEITLIDGEDMFLMQLELE